MTIVTIIATVLGIIAGILASINHKYLAIWVLFASLTAYSLSVCIYLQDYISKDVKNQTETSSSNEPQNITPPEDGKAQSDAQPRMFVTIQAQDIQKMYQENTRAQGDKLLQAYIGKWIKISGKVSNVTTMHTRQGSFLVTIWLEPKYLVSAISTNKDWNDFVPTLRRDDQINIVGRIESAESTSLDIIDCEVVR